MLVAAPPQQVLPPRVIQDVKGVVSKERGSIVKTNKEVDVVLNLKNVGNKVA